jgi:hypothetical protein
LCQQEDAGGREYFPRKTIAVLPSRIEEHKALEKYLRAESPLQDRLGPQTSVNGRLVSWGGERAASISLEWFDRKKPPKEVLIGSEKVWEHGVALTSTLHWFETDLLRREENLTGVARFKRELIGRAEAMDSGYWAVLGMDSTEIPVYGEQKQRAYNGHLERRVILRALCLEAWYGASPRFHCQPGRRAAGRWGFGDEGDMGGQGIGIIGWKRSSLGLRKPEER